VRVLPFSAIEFSSFEAYKGLLLHDPTHTRSALHLLLCGTLAGFTASITTYPLDITRTYLSLQTTGGRHTFMQAAQLIYHNEGGRGFYRGLVITLLGISPYIGIKMSTFDICKNYFMTSPDSPYFVVVNMACGALAATAAATLTYPSDVLRRRIQMLVGAI
jgi:solute carrier family 25 phosphate transporter 23/24/25/41